MQKKSSAHNPAVCFGVVLIFVGALFLLVNFTGFSIGFGRWWPVILIVAGLVDLLSNRSRWFRGAGTLSLGGLFLLDTLNIWDVPWRLLWPIPILVIGLSIILGAAKGRARRKELPAEAAGLDGLDVNATFGERAQSVVDQNFPGGRVNAVFGQAQADLTQAGLANGEATVNVSAVFGSVVIRVPADWAVDLRAGATFGEVADKRPQPAPDAPNATLIITGSVTFGSIEIRP